MELENLKNLYAIKFNKSAITDFNKSLKTDNGNSLNQILIDVAKICQGDFESVSELSSQVSKVVSNMYELNYNLMFNDPVKNHIPVLTALVKSVMCYHLGDLSIDVQKNNKSAAQLYGLAFDHMLQGKETLSFSDINSELFDTFENVVIDKFMNSYSKFVGVSREHSIIALKHYLMSDHEKTNEWYTSELLTSMGHGFFSILSNLNDISPQDNWMPFTNNYFAQKCVEAHEMALKFDMDNGQEHQNSGKYYLQSAALLVSEQQVCNRKIFKTFFDYGLYELANTATQKLEKTSSDRWEMIQNLSSQRGFEELIGEYNKKYDSFNTNLKKNADIFSGCSSVLSGVSTGNYQNIGPLKENQFIHNIFNDFLKAIPDTKNDADRTLMLKTLIDSVSSLYHFEEESILVDVLAGIRHKDNLGTTEKDTNKLLNNAKKLNSLGLNLLETDDEKKIPDLELLSVFKGSYFDTLKKTLTLRVAQLQFLLELSKVLNIEYDRRELSTFWGIRSLIAINSKEELIGTVFDDVDDYVPIMLTLRFKILELISKAIHQLSPYEDSNITVDTLLSKLKKLESSHVVFGARDEGYIYEYSESSRILMKLISEVLSGVASGKVKPITEYIGHGYIDSNYGWSNLLDLADSFNKAAIIHHHASMILKENGDEEVASQAQRLSRECEGKAHLLAAFFYESKKNMSQKADDMYTKSIAGFMDAGKVDVVEAITSRKFWFREQNNSHEGMH